MCSVIVSVIAKISESVPSIPGAVLVLTKADTIIHC